MLCIYYSSTSLFWVRIHVYLFFICCTFSGMCQPRAVGTVGAEPFSARLRYSGAEETDHPNLIKLTVTMPHIDGKRKKFRMFFKCLEGRVFSGSPAVCDLNLVSIHLICKGIKGLFEKISEQTSSEKQRTHQTSQG